MIGSDTQMGLIWMDSRDRILLYFPSLFSFTFCYFLFDLEGKGEINLLERSDPAGADCCGGHNVARVCLTSRSLDRYQRSTFMYT